MAGPSPARPSRRPLIYTLAVVAVLAAVGAFVLVNRTEETGGGAGVEGSRPAFPTLVESRGNVRQIEIGEAQTGRVSVRLVRPADAPGWRLATMADYPVPDDRVSVFLDTLAAAELITPVDPAQVPETGGARPAWRRITLGSGAGEVLEAFDLGPEKSSPKASELVATHIRAGDGEAIWLADLVVERAIEAPHAWIDTQLLAVARAAVAEVRTAPDQGAPLRIRRRPGGASQFELPGTDGDLRTDEAWKLTDLTVPFTDMIFDSVAWQDSAPSLFDGDWPGYMRTTDGLILRFAVARRDDGAWMRFRLDRAAPLIQDDAGLLAETNPASADLDLAALRARLDGRMFQVPNHVADRLTRARESIAVEEADGQGDAAAGSGDGTAE